jgi:redox-sensitive bicupin YhaK (pirin superfamily)
MFYAPCEVDTGAVAGLPADQPQRAAYVSSGRVEVYVRSWHDGQMLVFAPGETVTVKAEQPSTVMVLGGEPVGLRHLW